MKFLYFTTIISVQVFSSDKTNKEFKKDQEEHCLWKQLFILQRHLHNHLGVW